MYRILICDDEKPTCDFIESTLIRLKETQQLDLCIDQCYTADALLKNIGEKDYIDLLFLDIELPDMNGAEAGRILREEYHNEEVQIIYISSKSQYAMQLFQTRPFDFLIKPIEQNAVIHLFEKYMTLYGVHQKFFHYKVGKREEKVLYSEIMYFMCEQRKIYIITRREKISFYGKMKELHKAMQAAGFWSVHYSYIINVKYVKKFKNNEIVMYDDYAVPISSAYKEKVKEKILHLDEGDRNGVE